MGFLLAQSSPVIIVQKFNLLEFARVLRNECTLLQDWDDVGEAFVVREIFDISHQRLIRNIRQRIGDSGVLLSLLDAYKKWAVETYLASRFLFKLMEAKVPRRPPSTSL